MSPDDLARLHAAAMAPERPWTAGEFAALLPGAILFGDDRAILLGRVAADEAEVLTLATHPDHRRRGLAAALLHAFHAGALDRGAATAFLEVAEDNVPARGLYASAGYREAGRRPRYYARPGKPAVAALVLARPLG